MVGDSDEGKGRNAERITELGLGDLQQRLDLLVADGAVHGDGVQEPIEVETALGKSRCEVGHAVLLRGVEDEDGGVFAQFGLDRLSEGSLVGGEVGPGLVGEVRVVGRDTEAGTDDLTALFDDGLGGVQGEGAGVGNAGDEETLVLKHGQTL